VARKNASRGARLKKPSERETRAVLRRSAGSVSARSDNEELFSSLLEGLEIGVANVSAGGVILYANSRFVEMLQTRAQPVIGAPLTRFISEASWPALNIALAQGMKAPTEGEMKMMSASGGLRTIQLSLKPIQLGGMITAMIAATEVTELVEKNKALRATEESLHLLSARILQLQDQERRRIARDLHDITGQELAVVVMSLNQLANNLDNPGVNARQILGDAVELARKIEDEIRTLSYLLHPPLLDEFGLRSALNWYAEGFTKRSGIEVAVETPRDLPRLSLDKETALFRVVQESLTNVLRHSNSSKARIRIRLNDGTIRLSVDDEGQGISREALTKISEGTASGVGTLGMRERLQQLGGTLKFRPRPKGTQVVATLPIDKSDWAITEEAFSDAATEQPSETAEAASAQTRKKRILIADDHEVTRQGIRSLLQDELDLEICGEAQDGLEAVAKVRELNPDLVIMDISMPGASGLSAATTIRDSGAHAKILFFTTHTYSEIERMSRVGGFAGFVTKTNAARDLVRGVRAVLAGNKFFNSEIVRTATD
jgi:PAS domain S-box-containing protein